LLRAGHDVVVTDNLCNSSAESLNRVVKIAGRAALFIEGDVRDRDFFDKLFVQHKINAVYEPDCFFETGR
jgi:UDP-glucose 4-epimerase